MTASIDQPIPPGSPSTLWGLDRIDQRALPLSGTYSYDTDRPGGRDLRHRHGGPCHPYRFRWSRRPRLRRRGRRRAGGDRLQRSRNPCRRHRRRRPLYGVAKEATIVPVKVLNSAGLRHGLVHDQRDQLGDRRPPPRCPGGGQPQPRRATPTRRPDAAINALIADGVTVVVAAGNDALPTCNYSPGRVPNAITVAASEVDDDDADYSNFGPCNDIYAPGSSILSSLNTTDTAAGSKSGTSMATPKVAGAAARMTQTSPAMTPVAGVGGARRREHEGRAHDRPRATRTSSSTSRLPRRRLLPRRRPLPRPRPHGRSGPVTAVTASPQTARPRLRGRRPS